MAINNNTSGLSSTAKKTLEKIVNRNNVSKLIEQNDAQMNQLMEALKKYAAGLHRADKLSIVREYGDETRVNTGEDLDTVFIEVLLVSMDPADLRKIVSNVEVRSKQLSNKVLKDNSKRNAITSSKMLNESGLGKDKSIRRERKAFKEMTGIKVRRSTGKVIKRLRKELKDLFESVTLLQIVDFATGIGIDSDKFAKTDELCSEILSKCTIFVEVMSTDSKKNYTLASGMGQFISGYKDILQYTSYASLFGLHGVNKKTLEDIRKNAKKGAGRDYTHGNKAFKRAEKITAKNQKLSKRSDQLAKKIAKNIQNRSNATRNLITGKRSAFKLFNSAEFRQVSGIDTRKIGKAKLTRSEMAGAIFLGTKSYTIRDPGELDGVLIQDKGTIRYFGPDELAAKAVELGVKEPTFATSDLMFYGYLKVDIYLAMAAILQQEKKLEEKNLIGDKQKKKNKNRVKRGLFGLGSYNESTKARIYSDIKNLAIESGAKEKSIFSNGESGGSFVSIETTVAGEKGIVKATPVLLVGVSKETKGDLKGVVSSSLDSRIPIKKEKEYITKIADEDILYRKNHKTKAGQVKVKKGEAYKTLSTSSFLQVDLPRVTDVSRTKHAIRVIPVGAAVENQNLQTTLLMGIGDEIIKGNSGTAGILEFISGPMMLGLQSAGMSVNTTAVQGGIYSAANIAAKILETTADKLLGTEKFSGARSAADTERLAALATGGYGKYSGSRKISQFISGDSLTSSPNPEKVSIDWERKTFSVKPIPMGNSGSVDKFATGGTVHGGGAVVKRMTAVDRTAPMGIQVKSGLVRYTKELTDVIDDGTGTAIKTYSINNPLTEVVNLGNNTNVTAMELLSSILTVLTSISETSAGNLAIDQSTLQTANAILKKVGSSQGGSSIGVGFTNELNSILQGD